MEIGVLKQILKENATVYTRTLSSDYKYHFKSLLLDSNESIYFQKNGFEVIDKKLKSKDGTTPWFKMNVSKGVLLFRGVRDGRTDECSRKIKRVEGSIVPKEFINGQRNLDITLDTLVTVLNSIQNSSNNYGYGFPNISNSFIKR